MTHGTPSKQQKEKALISFVGGLAGGVTVGVAIGLTVWSLAEGLAVGLAMGAGGGGVLAALYYGGDLE